MARNVKTKRVTLDNGRSYDIPVGEDGYVPESALLKRYNDPYKGVADGRKKRNILKDYNDYADIVLPGKVTPEQAARWWDCPAKLDIEGIDTPGQIKKKGGIKYRGTDGEVTKMDQMMTATQSPAERKRIAEEGTVYTARPMKMKYKGVYYPGRNEIELNRMADGLEHQTLAHETTHMMRDRDDSRKNIVIKRNAQMNVEESCTVAEQMARSRDPDFNGYYQKIPVFDEKTRRWRSPTYREAEKMADEDYLTLTYGRGKPLKEKEARQSVEKNWANTNIARLRYKSKSMAITSLAMQDKTFAKKDEEIRSLGRKPEVKTRTVPKAPVKKAGGSQTKFFSLGRSAKKQTAAKGRKKR